MCGDNYADARPRANELGGRFGGGKIAAVYHQSQVIQAVVEITAHHKGKLNSFFNKNKM